VAEELIRRAQTFLTERDEKYEGKRRELGVTDDIASIEVLTPQMLVALGEKDIKSLDDLADLASDELIEIVGADAMDAEVANEVIMAARAHWFDDEATPAEDAVDEEPGDGDAGDVDAGDVDAGDVDASNDDAGDAGTADPETHHA